MNEQLAAAGRRIKPGDAGKSAARLEGKIEEVIAQSGMKEARFPSSLPRRLPRRDCRCRRMYRSGRIFCSPEIPASRQTALPASHPGGGWRG